MFRSQANSFLQLLQPPAWLRGARAVSSTCCLLGMSLKVLQEDWVTHRCLPCACSATDWPWSHSCTLKANLGPGSQVQYLGPGSYIQAEYREPNDTHYWNTPHWNPPSNPDCYPQASTQTWQKAKLGCMACIHAHWIWKSAVTDPFSPKPETLGGPLKYC